MLDILKSAKQKSVNVHGFNTAVFKLKDVTSPNFYAAHLLDEATTSGIVTREQLKYLSARYQKFGIFNFIRILERFIKSRLLAVDTNNYWDRKNADANREDNPMNTLLNATQKKKKRRS